MAGFNDARMHRADRDLVQAVALRDKQEIALENLLASLRKLARIDIAPGSPPASPGAHPAAQN